MLKKQYSGGLTTKHWNIECFNVQIFNGSVFEWPVIAIAMVPTIFNDWKPELNGSHYVRISNGLVLDKMVANLFKMEHHWNTERHWKTKQRATIRILNRFSILAHTVLGFWVVILRYQ